MKLFEAASLLIVSTVFITFVSLSMLLRHSMGGGASFHVPTDSRETLLAGLLGAGVVLFGMATRQLYVVNRQLTKASAHGS